MYPKSRYCSKIHALFIIYLTKNVIKSLFELSKAYNFEATTSCFLIFYDLDRSKSVANLFSKKCSHVFMTKIFIDLASYSCGFYII